MHDHHSFSRLRRSSAGALRSEGTAIIAAACSEATHRAYRTQWGLFTAWAEEAGLQPLPVSPATVARYLVARHQAGASVATLRPVPAPSARHIKPRAIPAL